MSSSQQNRNRELAMENARLREEVYGLRMSVTNMTIEIEILKKLLEDKSKDKQ